MRPNTPADGAPTGPPSSDPTGDGSGAFGPVAPYYDALMRDVPYAHWVTYTRDLLARHGAVGVFRPGCRVLDLACGTGTMSLMLADLGCQVTGVDISAAMVREARAKARAVVAPPEFLIQDAARLSVSPGAYDVCISLFDSLNYIVERSRLAQAFGRISRALKPHGVLVFDLNTPLALRTRMFDQEDTRPAEPVRYRWRSRFDEATSLCRIDMEFWADTPSGQVAAFTETHWQRAYSDAEVRGALCDAGLGDVHSYEAYRFSPPTPGTDRVFYVAQRAA